MEITRALPYELAPATETLAARRAAGDAREIVEPADDELFIDFDGVADGSDDDRLQDALVLLQRNGEQVEIIRETPSRTPGHRHIVLRMGRDLTPLERVALQACLGSDRKRELLAVLRVWNAVSPVTCFFEEPDGKI